MLSDDFRLAAGKVSKPQFHLTIATPLAFSPYLLLLLPLSQHADFKAHYYLQPPRTLVGHARTRQRPPTPTSTMMA